MRYTIRLLAVLLAAVATCFAEPVYMLIPNIEGEVVQKGREGWIQVFAFSHEVVSPRDPATGQATGKRQHQPFRCVLAQSKATPLLFAALAKNEKIPKVTINFFKASQTSGVETLYYKIELTNASLSSVRPWMANVKDPTVANFGSQVEIAFVYEKITWTATDGPVTSEDSWLEPRL